MCNVGTYDERNYRHDDTFNGVWRIGSKRRETMCKHFTFTSCVEKIFYINNKFMHACKPLNCLWMNQLN
jgi:hypothetical protein